MQAWVIEGGFGVSKLRLVERPDPQPGPGQVLVRVRACSLNYRDLMMVKGQYNPKQPLPLVPLSDGVGEVVAIGPGVSRVKPGARVVGCFLQKWISGLFSPEARASTLGGPLDGMLRELALLDAEGVEEVPAYLGDEEAATLPCAALTAWHALVAEGDLKAGEWVLLLGTGGVSIFGLQIAKLLGAKAVITSSDPAKLERARALGADAVIPTGTDPAWDRKVRELTGGQGADHVVEVGGGDTLARSLNAVRFGGRIYIIGVLGGATAELPLTSVLMKNARLQGVFVGSREMLSSMLRAFERGRVKPVVDRVFPFGEAVQAFAHMEGKKHFGKIVIRI